MKLSKPRVRLALVLISLALFTSCQQEKKRKVYPGFLYLMIMTFQVGTKKEVKQSMR